MADTTIWDYLLLATGSYLALVTLVRMMRRTRDRMVDQLIEQTRQARERQRAAERRTRQRRLMEQLSRDQQKQRRQPEPQTASTQEAA